MDPTVTGTPIFLVSSRETIPGTKLQAKNPSMSAAITTIAIHFINAFITFIFTLLLLIAIKKIMKNKFNYIFFGAFFFILLIMNIQHVALVSDPVSGSRVLYMVLAILQTTFEFGILAWAAIFFKSRLSKKMYYSYIGLVFVFFSLHIVDFILLRVMNLSFLTAVDMMLGETWQNFIEMLKLTGIPLGVWVALVPLALILPVVGVYLYHLSDLASKKHLCTRSLTCSLCLLPVGLMGICLLLSSSVDPSAHRKFASIMPFKGTILGPQPISANIEQPIKMPLLEYEHLPVMKARAKPNIYLFVAESIRHDYFNEDIAPNLSPNCQKAIAAGNGTQISWYSIFHANSPLTWSTYQKFGPAKGALPLRLLKQMGYEIHCHSAAQLKYYKMDQLLFGQNHDVLTSYNVFPHKDSKSAWQSDELAMQSLSKNLKSNGQVHIVFLDSTHFHYSWNPDFDAPFAPHSNGTSHGFTSGNPEVMEKLKNNYKNSIAYVDYMLGRFNYILHKRGLYKDAVIAFTGDHGEEFYEEGNLFHASNLSPMQCEVPLFLKLGRRHVAEQEVISHMDIMPTILEHITGKRQDFFDGSSLLDPFRNQVAMTARFNASRNPREVACYKPMGRVVVEIGSSRNIFKAKQVKVLSSSGDGLEHDPLAPARPYFSLQAPPEELRKDRDGDRQEEKIAQAGR